MTIKFYDKYGNWLFSYHYIDYIMEYATHLYLHTENGYEEEIQKDTYWNFEIIKGECED